MSEPWPHHPQCTSHVVIHLCSQCLELVHGPRMPRQYTVDEVCVAADSILAMAGAHTNEHRTPA